MLLLRVERNRDLVGLARFSLLSRLHWKRIAFFPHNTWLFQVSSYQ